MSETTKSKGFKTSIGGQALMEGIMMRGPKKQSIVVNTKNGFVTKTEDVRLPKDKHPILGVLFIRGVVNFIDSMVVGMRAITYSAEFALDEEEEEELTGFDKWINDKLGNEKAEKVLIGIAIVIAVALMIGMFFILPTALAGLLSRFFDHNILRSLTEGVLRIIIFILYLWLATRLKDIKRMWAYHGAEHKAIYCYERGLELTVENVEKQSKQHPRCGTSFLFIVMIVSVLVFSLTTWTNVWMRVGMRLILLPVVVAISYEIIKLAGRYDNTLTRIISAPGKALQRLTTSEPDEAMIQTAIEAISEVIPENETEAQW
jgi:uncharacterized protein YqhQ